MDAAETGLFTRDPPGREAERQRGRRRIASLGVKAIVGSELEKKRRERIDNQQPGQ